MRSAEEVFLNLLLDNVVVSVYMLGPFMEDRIGCNLKGDLVVTVKLNRKPNKNL